MVLCGMVRMEFMTSFELITVREFRVVTPDTLFFRYERFFRMSGKLVAVV